MTQAESDSYYEREYRLEYQGGEGPNQKDLAAQRGRADSLTGFVQGVLPGVARHLDIGASAGWLLLRIQENYQNQSIGVEPGEAYRNHAQSLGFTVYPSLDALEKAGEARFDLVSMAHVLEHLPDPVAYLEHLRTYLLEDPGHLLLEVPNLYAHECFETAHMISYSAHTLEQALVKAGYMVEKIEAHGRPRSEVIPLYLTALARPQSQEVSSFQLIPERGVVYKRKVGMLRRRLLTKLVPGKAWHPIK